MNNGKKVALIFFIL